VSGVGLTVHTCVRAWLRLLQVLDQQGPRAAKSWRKLWLQYSKLPTNVVAALYGLCLCFFGGFFPMSLAAYEAFKQTGWEKTRTCLHDIRVRWPLPANILGVACGRGWGIPPLLSTACRVLGVTQVCVEEGYRKCDPPTAITPLLFGPPARKRHPCRYILAAECACVSALVRAVCDCAHVR
jgi:hypothetical protein